MVKHIGFVYMKNESDTEDVFQDVFLKYALFLNPFSLRNTEMRSFFRRNTCSLEEAMAMAAPGREEHSEVLEAVIQFPEKYRILIYLHYYEGYSSVEIAGILHKNVNTVYTHLARARAELKNRLGGEEGETVSPDDGCTPDSRGKCHNKHHNGHN